MNRGIILTNAPSWDWVLANVPPTVDTIKVVTGWGLPWTPELRRNVFDRFSTVIVRTVCGDLSHANGLHFMPEAWNTEQEISPWHEAWNRKSRFIVQIGNEPLLEAVQNENLAWQYAWHLDASRSLVASRFKAETMSFAHMINHWVMLNGRKDGQRRWTEIAQATLQKFDLLGVNAYTADQIRLGIEIYRGVNLSQPIWLSEFNLNEPLSLADRGRRFQAVLAPFRTTLQGVTAYHLVHAPDNHPIHSNPHYTLHRETLVSWQSQEPTMTTPTPPPAPLPSPASVPVTWVGMTRTHFWPGRTNPIRCVVVHSTAGRYPGDYNWLRNGGHQTNQNQYVSVHYYIRKNGEIFQMVKDEDRAWHAGESEWVLDGTRRTSLNQWSIGIELENLNNGTDPYPKAQVDSCIALTRQLVQKYNIPMNQVVGHYHISPGRKNDPRGFAWDAFVQAVAAGNDPWADWGTSCPLAPEQRGWLIPQTWLPRRHELGHAVTFEQYLTPQTSVQVFAKGLIVYTAVKKECRVVLF